MSVIPAGYKQTEVGVIPEEWECARISSVAILESGHTPSKREPSYWSGSIPWVSLFDTEGLQGKEIFETAKMITEEGLNNSSARLLPKGTVVFSRTATVGKTTVMGREMATSQDFANYICSPKLHNHFLVYLFRNMGRTWKSLMAGSIHNTIYMPVFKALKIILPPLPEQLAIASALSDVDALLGGLDQLIAKKRDIKQATMQQLLTGQTRLPGFGGLWNKKSLSRICSMKSGEGITSANIDQFSKYPCYGGNGLRGYATRFTHDGGYALIGRQGALCGNVYGVEGQFFASEHAIVVTASADTDIRWLTSMLGRMNLNQYSESSAQPGLSVSKILKLEIAAPPTKAEQTAIAEVLTDMDAELAALEQRREKTRALKQAMMQELLTGRTRLVECDGAKHKEVNA